MGKSEWTWAGINDEALSKTQAAISAGLFVLFVFLMVKAVMVFIAPDSYFKIPVTSSAPVMTAKNNTPADFDYSFDPFHRAQTTAARRERGLGEDAPETTLNLTLVGRRAGEGGTAILVTPDRQQAVYSIGDEVINGVNLEAVNPDFIVLSQNGRLERLTFNKDAQTGLAEQAVQTDVPVPVLSAAVLLQSVTLTRVDQNNRLIGFRVRAKSAAINLGQYGLRPNDIITRIGSEDLTQGRPEFATIARDISAQSAVQIELIRGGAPLIVTVGRT